MNLSSFLGQVMTDTVEESLTDEFGRYLRRPEVGTVVYGIVDNPSSESLIESFTVMQAQCPSDSPDCIVLLPMDRYYDDLIYPSLSMDARYESEACALQAARQQCIDRLVRIKEELSALLC